MGLEYFTDFGPMFGYMAAGYLCMGAGAVAAGLGMFQRDEQLLLSGGAMIISGASLETLGREAMHAWHARRDPTYGLEEKVKVP